MNTNMDIRKVKIEIGKTDNGKAFYYKPHEMSQLLIAGKSGAGKTFLIKKIIKGLQKELSSEYIKFGVFDSKEEAYEFTNNSAYTYLYYCSKNDEYVELLKYTSVLLHNRKELFKQMSLRNIEEYNQGNKEKLGYIFLIADDFGELSQDAINLLTDLSMWGRSLGIYIILSTSNTTIDEKRLLTGMVKTSFLERICFKVDTKIESKLVIDSYGAEELNENKNEALVNLRFHKENIKISINNQ
ncbi:MAG: FtsK/SpoIIIE domain-containing protein [Bacilli bacterium]|nr:FtsK/SpoIIIE domain-containing protein [Bacilli bacterium]